jgi:hypothetical protein
MKKNDSLKKHHFWILAGLAPLLALLTIVFLMTGPGGAKDKAAEEIKKNNDTAKGSNPPGKVKLEKDFPEQKKTLNERREILWKANYEAQKGIFGWPQSPRLADLEKRYTKFGAKMETLHNQAFEDFKNRDVYEAAYDRVAEEIKPTTFPGGSWRRVLRYVSNWTEKYPTSDQIWLALEDLWVQRGLLLPVKEVNAAASKFELVKAPAGPDGKQADPPPLKRTFRNRVWELELEVPTTGPHANKAMLAKLKNRTNRIQMLGTGNQMKLNVQLSEGAQPVRYVIQKDFAKANEEIKVETPLPVLHMIPPGTEVQAITRVEQVLDERTVPVRQVLNVELGYKDARHHTATLVKAEWWPETAAATGGDMGGMPGGPGMMPGGPGMMPGGPGMMPGGEVGSPDDEGGRGRLPGMPGAFGGMGGTTRAAKSGTPTAVLDYNKDRYAVVTKQVRRMPVAVVLLVDQMFVQDALVAYANSPLRFQITQYHWKRFRGTLSSATGGFGGGMGFPSFGGGFEPGAGDTGAGGEAGTPDGEYGSPDGGSGYVLPGRGGMGGPGMMMPGGEGGPGYGGYGGYGGGYGMMGGGTTGSISEGQITSGLVELTLYGIVTLYEKYEVQPADGTAPTDGTTPAAGNTTGTGTTTAPAPTEPKAGTTPTTEPKGTATPTTEPKAGTTPTTDPKSGTATPAPMKDPTTPAPATPGGTTPGSTTPETPPKK